MRKTEPKLLPAIWRASPQFTDISSMISYVPGSKISFIVTQRGQTHNAVQEIQVVKFVSSL
jgi:hypothetical protein